MHRKHLLLQLVCVLMVGAACAASRVDARDGWFYVDGEKFFIKGVCFFENHNVEGQFARSSIEIMDEEFRRIKEAGFNTIRSQLRPEELALARKHGLMVMQAANHLFFSHEYKDPSFVKQQLDKTREISAYSAEHDNILYYIVDNEPEVTKGIHRQGKEAIEAFYRKLVRAVKDEDPDAVVSMATFPPAAFLDYSMFDCISLNLYTPCPSAGVLGYEDYASWFRAEHADGKPFVFSEYGWTVNQGESGFSENMMRVLDQQIASGACGSFFYTWRAFGTESEGANLWLGVVPNQSGKEDYKGEARAIAGNFKRYFEAVVVEPKVGKSYVGQVPVEVYGTDRTRSVDVMIEDQKIVLKRDGRFWWKGSYTPGDDALGSRVMTIVAHGDDDAVLVKKEVPFRLVAQISRFRVRADLADAPLYVGGSYKASFQVENRVGEDLPAKELRIGVNQTGKDMWVTDAHDAPVDKEGICLFKVSDLVPGYLTIMAAVISPDPSIRVKPAVVMRRVEGKAEEE